MTDGDEVVCRVGDTQGHGVRDNLTALPTN